MQIYFGAINFSTGLLRFSDGPVFFYNSHTEYDP